MKLLVLALAAFTGLSLTPAEFETSCQEQADAYCVTACYDAISSRPCDGPMKALQSGPGTDKWRCYSPSTLDDANETYVEGDCYCTRDGLSGLQKECDNENPIVTVFAAKMDGAECYRIPSIIETNSINSTLLAFAEQRVSDCGDNGDNNIVVRRSSDGGSSWGPILPVVSGVGAISNPNPVEVTLADGSKSVLMHYDTMNNPSSSNHGLNMQTWSHDDGRTWSDPTDVSAYMPDGFVGCMPGPSIGVQASDGTIYFSCHGFGLYAFLYWSSDYGATWSHSEVVGPDDDGNPGLNECSIALLADESVAMNCRTDSTHGRAQLTWSAAGELIEGPTFPDGLIDPGCQGSVVSVTTADGVALYLSNDDSSSGRERLSIKSSKDDGISWDSSVDGGDSVLVWDGPTAYSQLVVMTDRTLGVLFEMGVSSSYEAIGFAKFG